MFRTEKSRFIDNLRSLCLHENRLTCIVSEHCVFRIICIRPYDCQGFDMTGRKRQGVLVILQKHHALNSCLCSQVLMFLTTYMIVSQASVRLIEGVSIEDSQPHENGESIIQSSIDVGFGYQSLLYSRSSIGFNRSTAIQIKPCSHHRIFPAISSSLGSPMHDDPCQQSSRQIIDGSVTI